MPALHYGSAAILGYLFGNLQSAIILSRLLRKPDIRTRGSETQVLQICCAFME